MKTIRDLYGFLGTPLAEDQGVSVLIGPKLYIEESLAATSITIYASKLQDLHKTAYLGFMERWDEQVPQEATSVGGKITAKYQAERKSVEVND